jgi:hypothetical protein
LDELASDPASTKRLVHAQFVQQHLHPLVRMSDLDAGDEASGCVLDGG